MSDPAALPETSSDHPPRRWRLWVWLVLLGVVLLMVSFPLSCDGQVRAFEESSASTGRHIVAQSQSSLSPDGTALLTIWTAAAVHEGEVPKEYSFSGTWDEGAAWSLDVDRKEYPRSASSFPSGRTMFWAGIWLAGLGAAALLSAGVGLPLAGRRRLTALVQIEGVGCFLGGVTLLLVGAGLGFQAYNLGRAGAVGITAVRYGTSTISFSIEEANGSTHMFAREFLPTEDPYTGGHPSMPADTGWERRVTELADAKYQLWSGQPELCDLVATVGGIFIVVSIVLFVVAGIGLVSNRPRRARA